MVAVVTLGVLGVALVTTGQAPGLTPPPPLAQPPQECSAFAAVNGSDSAPGSWRRPVRTVERLVDVLRSGQTGCLRAGRYVAANEYTLKTNKSNYALRSYPGERAVLEGIVKITSGAKNVRLASLDIVGPEKNQTNENTIVVYAVSDFVLEDSDITNQWHGNSCLYLGDSQTGPALRPLIRRNVFHECGRHNSGSKDHGIYANTVHDGLITDNIFYNPAGYGIQLYPNAVHTVISHNVFDGSEQSTRGGVVFGGDSDRVSSDNVVERNIISYGREFNISASFSGVDGTGNLARNNCVFGARKSNIESESGFTAENNVTADPQFVNRAARDYRLKSGSPCLAVVGYDTAARIRG